MRQRVLAALIAAAGVAGAMTMAAAGPATAAARPAAAGVAASSGWGKAALLRDAGQLGHAAAYSVSCPSAGNCTAGGTYDTGTIQQVFVISERAGRWGKAEEVPGLGALNTGGDGELAAISCGSAGNCVATGTYEDSGGWSAYVAVQKGWQWGKAKQIPGLAALNTGDYSQMGSASCSSAGNCVIGGTYDNGTTFQAFVATLRKWHWVKAIEVPGIATLDDGYNSELIAVSCRKAGDCSAGGDYSHSGSSESAFVVTEKNGHWGKASQLPGLAAINAGNSADIDVLSCGAAGNCAAGGLYRDAKGHQQAFLAVQKNGSWGKAGKARGTGTLNTGGDAQVTALSCPSAGNCVAGGIYNGGSVHFKLFLITEHDGTWGKAATMPGISSHNKGTSTQVYTLSCSSAGNCSAGGYYENAAFREFAFVITESGGHWGSLEEVPGIASKSPGGDSGVNQLSCPSSGHCTGVGYGHGGAHFSVAFSVART
jgi:hypothetical protein